MNIFGLKSLYKGVCLALTVVFGLLCPGGNAVYAADINCSMCHPDITGKNTVHAAVSMGCSTCHTSLNAAEMPHKVTGKIAKGLSAEQPELCYGCHDKAKFTKKNLHAVLAMGCKTCHDPHSTDNSILLSAAINDLCLQCHTDVLKKPHAISGFGNSGHPLSGRKYKDKSKIQKELLCTSCHNPHSSDSQRLFQFTVDTPFDICKNCHNF